MIKFKKFISVMTCFFVAFAGFTLLPHIGVSATPNLFSRLGGSNRYLTSIAVSKDGWPNGSDYIVIASGENYPDALCAAPLAKLYNAPILLTPHDSLKSSDANNSLEAEIKRLKPTHAFIIGGNVSVFDTIINELVSLGIPQSNCKRISASNRYGTSLEIAKNILQVTGTFTSAAVASGDNFPDALSIASIAAAKKMPILLAGKSGINTDISDFIKSNNSGTTYIIGDVGVVPGTVDNSVPSPKRLKGSDRYHTNLAVINEFSKDSNISMNNLYVAAGASFPDALSGSAEAALTGSPILLAINNYSVMNDSMYLVHSNLRNISAVTVLGGTTALPDELAYKMTNPQRLVLGYTFADGQTMDYMQSHTSTIDEIATYTYTTDSKGNVDYGKMGDGTPYPLPKNTIGYANSVGIRPLALVTNGDTFDAAIADSMLSSSTYRQNFISGITQFLKDNNYAGVNIDFENVLSKDRQNYSLFIQQLSSQLHALNYLVTVSVPAKSSNISDAYDYAQLGKYADEIAIMAYDYNGSASGTVSGPIAPINSVTAAVNYAVTVIPRYKILLGLEAYGEDFNTKSNSMAKCDIGTINSLAQTYNVTPTLDSTSKCEHFDYTDNSGALHHVWFENATSVAYKLNLVNSQDLAGIAIWQMAFPDTNYMDKIKTVFSK